ncbi:hypothetical protein DFP97_106313 [Paenibacillus prosopidis]|uniref:DUF4359 domain-containing protein n=1 Tax=Paenibacillus prosopidis TaxID=630520 RepID=A0A368W2B0_9BACL|nr:hypothetical protein DFP97_106313 [Paenibacillus prosopidis]
MGTIVHGLGVNMKRFMKASLIILGIVLILLVFTCPNDNDYKLWLAKKYGISCEVGGPEQIILCKRGQNPIEWEGKHVQSLPFFMKVEDRYTEANKEYTIRAIGILNFFFDYSIISVYD